MTKRQTIERIARELLDLDTLETRRSDSLDFKEQAVWSIVKALDAAYEAGRNELLSAAEALLEAKDNQMETITEWRALRRAVRRTHRKAKSK